MIRPIQFNLPVVRAVAEITPPIIRSSVTDDEFGGFRVTIPAPDGSRYGFGCALAFCLIMAAFGLLYTVSDPSKTASGGFVFLLFWGVVGLLPVWGLLASTGRQVLMIDGKTLVLRWEGACWSRAEAFDLAGVRNLRPRRPFEGSSSALAFDHGGKTHYFGNGLSEYEVKRLVKTIRLRFPIPEDPDDVEPLPVIK
jgi:hypothetical protein